MTVVVFLLDTSGTMNQRAVTGTTLLDLAKGAIDQLVKLRQRAAKNDRFLLMTYAEGVAAIKVGWKHPHVDFLTEVKNLTATDLSCPAEALRTTLDHLNMFRLQSGIENYGQGRNPWFIEPVILISITDGGHAVSLAGHQLQALSSTAGLLFPLSEGPSKLSGSELTSEPFRWDQRLFTIILRLPGAGVSTQQRKAVSPTALSPFSFVFALLFWL